MADSSHLRSNLKGNVEEALRLFSSEGEWGGLNLAETEFVLEETLKCYGSTFDGGMIRSLFKYYHRYLGMSDVDRRQRLQQRVARWSLKRLSLFLLFISFEVSLVVKNPAIDRIFGNIANRHCYG